MGLIKNRISALFGHRTAAADAAATQPVRSATVPAATTPLFDLPKAARVYNVLHLLFPPPALEMTAYDDYYPMLFYGLRGVRVTGPQLIEDMRGFLESYRALLPEQEGHPFDGQAVRTLMTRHANLLRAVAQALEMPARDLNNLCDGGLSLLPSRDPCDSVRIHLRDNTRFGRAYHNEGVDELLHVISVIADEAALQPQDGPVRYYDLGTPCP